MKLQSRYPGTVPFLEKDRELFFGRDSDTRKLSNLIVLENLVVLFGKSGYGKSSLLNAAVLPKLREERGHNLFKIRLIPEDGSVREPEMRPLEIIKDQLRQNKTQSTFLNEKLDIPTELPDNLTAILWFYIKLNQLTHQNSAATTLVFYQFEDLFRYLNDSGVAEFGRSMAALLSSGPPVEVLELISKHLNSFSDKELEQLYEPLNLKLVFSVASDHLSFLNKLKRYLPHIFKYTYELKALTDLQAQKALIEPAKKNGKYNSPAFTYTEDAVKGILRYLKGKNKEGIELQNQDIETFQLQLIGQYAEEYIKKRKEGTKLEFSLKDLGEPGKILKKFYVKVIDSLDSSEKGNVKKLIEKDLIEKGNRVPMSENAIKRKYNLSEDLLADLEDQRLLRSEIQIKDNGTVKSYEISHDNLVKPIQEAAKRKKQRRLWIIVFIVFGLLMATIAALSAWIYDLKTEGPNEIIINAIGMGRVSPIIGEAPQEVEFIFEKTTNVDSISVTGYSWDFGDGDFITNVDSVSKVDTVWHTYKKVKNYKITLTVTDNYGKKRYEYYEIIVRERKIDPAKPGGVISPVDTSTSEIDSVNSVNGNPASNLEDTLNLIETEPIGLAGNGDDDNTDLEGPNKGDDDLEDNTDELQAGTATTVTGNITPSGTLPSEINKPDIKTNDTIDRAITLPMPVESASPAEIAGDLLLKAVSVTSIDDPKISQSIEGKKWMERFIKVQNDSLTKRFSPPKEGKNWRIVPDSLNLIGIVLDDTLNKIDSLKKALPALVFFFTTKGMEKGDRKVYKFRNEVSPEQSDNILQSERFSLNRIIRRARRSPQDKDTTVSVKFVVPDTILVNAENTPIKDFAGLLEQNKISDKTRNIYFTLFPYSYFDEATQKEIGKLYEQMSPGKSN